MIRVLIFNEFLHEKIDEDINSIYPEGIHMALKKALECEDIIIDTTTLESCAEDLTEERLRETDVMLWWGHMKHHLVPDEVADRVVKAVQEGMGIIFLHSSHFAKPFKKLMGTPCTLTWREDGDRELLWVCDPSHPITQGIGRFIKLDHEETYGEPFAIPEPDKLLFIGHYENGEVFRAGCCYKRGNGNIFYFQPGHESYPTYHNPDIIRVISNAIRWAAPICRIPIACPKVGKPLEEI